MDTPDSLSCQLQALKLQGEIQTMEANLTKKRYQILEYRRQEQELVKEMGAIKEQISAKQQQVDDLIDAHGPLQVDLP